MELQTNCKNCGAPLHYDKSNYGEIAKCEYCDTEYHIDLLGRIEEYKIKIEFMGKIKEYYIWDWEIKPIILDNYINSDGKMIRNKSIYKSKLTLIEM